VKLSEYIEQLKSFLKEAGDIDVVIGHRAEAIPEYGLVGMREVESPLVKTAKVRTDGGDAWLLRPGRQLPAAQQGNFQDGPNVVVVAL
jgi:hypothetical protein